MKKLVVLAATMTMLGAGLLAGVPAQASAPTYDISTLAGKVASLRGTAGLQIRFSSYVEEEAADPGLATAPASTPITPSFVLSSPLDGTSVASPAVTVNQDTAAAPQNETAIAVDPNRPLRVVGSANDYVTRTWTCTISGTPCSALGDGYSGTYFSNDGGSTWCCTSTDPAHLGTLIPGVTRLAGGRYDAGGDPALAFDSRGTVYYAGLGFNRTSAPNTVAVNRGTFDTAGHLSWSAPTFINPTTAPSTLNDKEWIAVDANPGSSFRDRVYVTWTRFLFSASKGSYVQSPIFFASSRDGGRTFTSPTSISGNVLYDQGSRPVVGPDGSLYVFFEGSTRLATASSTYVVKSTDGGASWGKPRAIATLVDSEVLKDTAFRDNSFPAAAVAPNGDLYATWTTMIANASTAVYSKSVDGGTTWSAPVRVFAAASRMPVGYPVSQPGGGTLTAPT
ncbi:MAG: sialidase family protein, partial [Dermatophilaceae bacterium]